MYKLLIFFPVQAFDALSEYLPSALVPKLRKFLNLPDEPKKTNSSTNIKSPNGVLKTNGVLRKALTENPAKKRKTAPVAPNNASNKISNYFTKK